MLRMMLGRTDEVDGKYVGTLFFSLIGPLFPLETWYVTGEQYSRSGNASTHAWAGRKIPFSFKSILLGYARVWLVLLAIAAPAAMMWGERVDFARGEWLIALVFWIASFFVGRLSTDEKKRRRVLEHATGFGLDPSFLSRFERSTERDTLGEDLPSKGIGDFEPATFTAQLEGVDELTLEKAWAFTRYAAVDEGTWRPVERAVWARLGARPADGM